MTHLFSIIALTLLLAGATIDRPINFSQQYLPAKENARDTNKPLILLFVSDQCRVCEDQKDILDSDSEIKNYIHQNFESATVNIDDFDGRAIRDYYNITNIPSLVVVEQNGTVKWTHNGHISRAKLISKLHLQSGNEKEVVSHTPSSPTVQPYKNDPVKTEPAPQPAERVVVSETTVHVNEVKSSKSYQIQYGFFGSEKNAEAMLLKLSNVGENGCYITSEVRDGKTYFRVLSERYRGADLAKSVQQRLKTKGIEGNIKEVH